MGRIGADFCNNSHDQRTLSISCRESTGIWIICSMRLLSFVIFSFLFANVFSKTYLVKTKEKAVKPKADENRQLAPKPDYNWGWAGECCKSKQTWTKPPTAYWTTKRPTHAWTTATHSWTTATTSWTKTTPTGTWTTKPAGWYQKRKMR